MLISLGLPFRVLRVTQKHKKLSATSDQCCVLPPSLLWFTEGPGLPGTAVLGTSFSAEQHHSTAVCEAALNMILGAYARAQSHS